MRLRAPHALLALFATLGLAWATAYARDGARSLDALDARISLVTGARLDGDGVLSGGQSLARNAPAAQTDALRALSSALALVPPGLAPPRVRAILAPELSAGVAPLKGVEFHEPTRSLLFGAEAARLSRAVWLHELAHLRLAGARPQELVAKRLIDAFEEGVADYYAAVFSGSPRLAALDEVRDLRAPNPLAESAWASLAFADFEPHALGLGLAAAWYAADTTGAQLDDVVTCLDGDSGLATAVGPASAVRALFAACSARGRPFARQLVHGWLPDAFLPPRENTL